jgi:hypothetical protein
MLHVFTCELQGAFNKNLKLFTQASLILLKGAQTLTFRYMISTLQPSF